MMESSVTVWSVMVNSKVNKNGQITQGHREGLLINQVQAHVSG